MENRTKRVVVYARVSSDRQDVDLSITAQLKALREYAGRNGCAVVKEFVDEAESGRSTARPAFREMIGLARMKPPPFEMILVWKLSRFARNREDSIIYKSLLRKQGIQVVSINEPIEDTPTGRLMEGIIEVIDEFYSSNLAQDITRGLRENASRGFFNGSRAPFGYMRHKVKDGDKARNTLVPDPDQVPIIQRIFNEIAGNKGLKEIAKSLNKDGIPSPAGGKWGKQRLHKIFINQAYIGRLVWGKNHSKNSNLPPVVKDNAWPAIIERQLFEKVQMSLNARAPKVTHPRVTSSDYLLSGMIKCHKCGAAYIGYGAKSGRFHYYVCGTTYAKGKDVCPSKHLRKERIENFITDKIRNHILTDENLTALINLSNEEVSNSNRKHEERMRVIDKEIEQWQGRLERLYEFVETRAIEPDRMATRIAEVQDKIEQMRQTKLEIEKDQWKQRAQVIDPQKVIAYVNELREFVDSRGLCERKSFLRTFIQSIEADDDKMIINYVPPVPPDCSLQEVVSVLDIVPSAPPVSDNLAMSNMISAIQRELKQHADAKTREIFQSFFKEKVTAHGVKTAVVTKIARKYFREVKPQGKREIFALSEELLKSDYTEEAFIAFQWAYWLRDEYEPGDFIVFERWLNKYVNNWAKCDSLCNHAIGSFIENYPPYIEYLKDWTGSEERWVRRASAVTLIIPARRGEFLKDIFEIADILLQDKDDLVQKGYGWMLKEASRKHQKEVFDYVMRNNKLMPRTALRYAIEKMPEELRCLAMGKG